MTMMIYEKSRGWVEGKGGWVEWPLWFLRNDNESAHELGSIFVFNVTSYNYGSQSTQHHKALLISNPINKVHAS